MLKSIHIFLLAFLGLGKTLEILENVTHHTQHHLQLTVGRLNARKFINTEVPQKYWNEAVTVITTHNGGNRSNIALPNITIT